MEITLTTTIPDETAARLQNGSVTPLPRRLLELAAIRAYESGLITKREAMIILGFEDTVELHEFFNQHDVRDPVSTPNLSRQRALSEVGRRQATILKKVESSIWPEEPDIPETPITSSVKDFLL
jgi:hypothetical protein